MGSLPRKPATPRTPATATQSPNNTIDELLRVLELSLADQLGDNRDRFRMALATEVAAIRAPETRLAALCRVLGQADRLARRWDGHGLPPAISSPILQEKPLSRDASLSQAVETCEKIDRIHGQFRRLVNEVERVTAELLGWEPKHIDHHKTADLMRQLVDEYERAAHFDYPKLVNQMILAKEKQLIRDLRNQDPACSRSRLRDRARAQLFKEILALPSETRKVIMRGDKRAKNHAEPTRDAFKVLLGRTEKKLKSALRHDCDFVDAARRGEFAGQARPRR